MARVGGLGKGLDSLIPSKGNVNGATDNKEPVTRTTVKTSRMNQNKDENSSSTKKASKKDEYSDFLLNINKVEPNPDQPRKEFDQTSLEELADSIKEHGIIQPLVVVKKDKFYEIISGERRWRAAKIAGLKSIPVVVKNLTPQQAMEVSLIENLQREDLNPLEEAFGYQQLMNSFSLKQEEVAKKVGKSRTAITNSLRLLKLDASIQKMIIEKQISMGHARALLGLESFDDQYDIAMHIIEEQLSVRETEELIRALKEDTTSISGESDHEKLEKSPIELQIEREYKEYELKLNRIMGTKVKIKQKKNNKGKIEIEYYSLDEFERIFHMLQEIPE